MYIYIYIYIYIYSIYCKKYLHNFCIFVQYTCNCCGDVIIYDDIIIDDDVKCLQLKKRAGNYRVIYIESRVPHNFPYYKNTTKTLR